MEHRFDELAKALAGAMSRRQALRLLAGGLAGALLAPLGLRPARADTPADAFCLRFCLARVKTSLGLVRCLNSCQDCVNHDGCPAGVSSSGRTVCQSCPDGYACVGVDTCCEEGFESLCAGWCYPTGTRCCGPGRLPCRFGEVCCEGRCCGSNEQCCHGACISKNHNCCQDAQMGFCLEGTVCSPGGLCCPPTGPCAPRLTPTFRKNRTNAT